MEAGKQQCMHASSYKVGEIIGGKEDTGQAQSEAQYPEYITRLPVASDCGPSKARTYHSIHKQQDDATQHPPEAGPIGRVRER